MRKNLLNMTMLIFGCLLSKTALNAQNPLSHPACGSGASASTVCLPFACDDGNPSTINDLVSMTCEGTICTPCMGTLISVTNIEVINMRDCGADLCGSNKFTADIEVTFDYTPVYRDFIITGDIYFSYDEKYCEYNENSITIKDQCFEADGDVIGLNVIFNDNPSLNYRKRWVGYALDPCDDSGQGHRIGLKNNSNNTFQNTDFTLAPNPAQNEVNLILSNNFTGIANLEIFDLSGKLQLTRKINVDTATNLDISDLSNGIYIVKMIAGDSILTKRLVKSGL